MLSTQLVSADQRDDLRRHRRRQLIQALLDRAQHLPDADRDLLEAVYRDGASLSHLARMAALVGDANKDPAPLARTLRRRLRAIVARLHDPRTLVYLEHGGDWPRQRRRVAGACLLAGLTQRQASMTLGISLHEIRKRLTEIDTITHAAGKRG